MVMMVEVCNYFPCPALVEVVGLGSFCRYAHGWDGIYKKGGDMTLS